MRNLYSDEICLIVNMLDKTPVAVVKMLFGKQSDTRMLLYT